MKSFERFALSHCMQWMIEGTSYIVWKEKIQAKTANDGLYVNFPAMEAGIRNRYKEGVSRATVIREILGKTQLKMLKGGKK